MVRCRLSFRQCPQWFSSGSGRLGNAVPCRYREFGRVPCSRHSTRAECPAKWTVNSLLFRIIRFDDAACDVCGTRRSAADWRGQPSLSVIRSHLERQLSGELISVCVDFTPSDFRVDAVVQRQRDQFAGVFQQVEGTALSAISPLIPLAGTSRRSSCIATHDYLLGGCAGPPDG
jgi:hypothetical protein